MIGWLIALIANPLVRMLERRLKVARKHTSMFLIIGVLGAIIGGIYLIGVKTVERETSDPAGTGHLPKHTGGF